MPDPIKIFCPSYKRPHDVRTAKVIGAESLILCVQDFEAEAYEKAHPNNTIMALPDSVRGNMAKIRNHIRDNADADRFVMMDDDVNWFGYHEQCKRIKMDWPHIQEMLENGFDMAEELGTVLWGVNLVDAPRCYRQYSPISFLSPVLGPFSCHLGHDADLRYDERLGLNEDYDYAIQVMRKYRKLLRFNKYFYVCEHLDQPGGCATHRSMDKEKAQAEIMIQKWGPGLISYKMDHSPNPRINCPLKGI